MTPRELIEYQVLRETIRDRGTARGWIAWAGLAVWGLLVLVIAALRPVPVLVLVPVVVLGVTFEVVFALHSGVERIGRYLQVYFEDATGWEHTAMSYGARFPGGSSDPLFAAFFILAALVNYVLAYLTGASAIEYGALGLVHILFIARILVARHQASGQRARDLERFSALKSGTGP